MREPTAEECEAGAKVNLDGVDFYAGWYPQMGGYGSKVWVELLESGCFDVFVFHDGEFPFGDEDDNPRGLHHCNADQFIKFGQWVKELQGDIEDGNEKQSG